MFKVVIEEEAQECVMGRFWEGELMGEGLGDNSDAWATDIITKLGRLSCGTQK